MCCSVLSPKIIMHDAYISGRSENNIKCILHDDLEWKNRTTRYILPRHWLYEWFSQFHNCGTYSVLSWSPSIIRTAFSCNKYNLLKTDEWQIPHHTIFQYSKYRCSWVKCKLIKQTAVYFYWYGGWYQCFLENFCLMVDMSSLHVRIWLIITARNLV